jgi:hypothetical protein
MKTGRIVMALVGSLSFAAAAPCAAQEPLQDFRQLNTRLRPGDTIWVTDSQGRAVKGRILSLSTDALTLEGGSRRSFGAPDVSAIRLRLGDPLGDGALIGLGVGGGLALVGCLVSVDGSDAGWCVLAAGVYGGIGAGIGVGIDALIPGKKILAYRAPASGGSPPARLSIAPFVTPRARGVAVSFAF